jgi:mannose-6-phosphate isomerase-like protein (cupin superfamily)
MKLLCALIGLAFFSISVWADGPAVRETTDVQAITVSPGVILRELTGRTAAEPMRSEKCSVAFFHLEPGRASAWSFNKVAEESFFILHGRGAVWTGGERHAVKEGSFILVPPGVVRSVRANEGETLEFYAVTSPAWSPDDDFMAQAPAGFTK